MKIQFVKETKLNGDIFYFTEIDGNYVNNSISMDIEIAKIYYNAVLENKGNSKEVLESVEIN